MALNERGLAGKMRVIGHELTGPTRAGLESGAIDVILDQSPEDEIRAGSGRGPTADTIGNQGSDAGSPELGFPYPYCTSAEKAAETEEIFDDRV